MSFETWHTYGYGTKISDIEEISFNKIKALIKSAPRYAKCFDKWLNDNNIAELDFEFFEDSYDGFYMWLANVLHEVILELEGVFLSACDEYASSNVYLLYEQNYPWRMTESEKSFTETDIQSLLVKYISQITDEPITIDYYDPENGG